MDLKHLENGSNLIPGILEDTKADSGLKCSPVEEPGSVKNPEAYFWKTIFGFNMAKNL